MISGMQLCQLVLPVALLICLASKIGAQDTTCTDTTAANWLAWSEWSTCSATCGACGYQTRTRSCLTTNPACACPGESTMVETCNLAVCRYPAAFACCLGQPGQYRGSFACLEANTTTTTAPAG